MGESWQGIALGTENDRFKAKYQQYVLVALLISLVVWLNIFLFTPELEIEAYRLREESIEVIDIPDVVDIPPPPQELPKPQVPIEAAPDAEVDEDVEIAETMPDDFSGAFSAPGAGSGPTQNFEAFDTKPELIKFVAPVYSEFAREAGFFGVVYVDVLVGTDGRVKQTRLQRGVHPLLDKAALEAAQRAQFTPGKQRDIPVEVWVTLPYGFILN
jgi:TonB family protein